MTGPARLPALALAAVVAACGEDAAVEPGLLLAEPSAVAVFRGYSHGHPSGDPYPHLAVANAASNDLTIVDAVSDVGMPAPVPLRRLVAPVPDRPALLASADLGDGGADLLVAVSAGDSRLQVIRTWAADLAIEGEVPLGGDVVALVAVPGAAPGAARIAAALSGGALAVATFARATDGSIDVAGATLVENASLGFQPVALAASDGPPRVWAASRDPLPGGALGVAGLDPATAGVVQELDAGAPTRLVAAARLAERGAGEAGLDPAGWATTAPVGRVYAVLDESGCGQDAPIACGLVALDADGTGLAPDFADTLAPGPRAPIAVPGRALALAASGPPALPPSQQPADQIYAPPFMRLATALGPRVTTGAAAVASSDGAIYYVDLGRWELPSDQLVHQRVGAAVTSRRAGDQWLVLDPPGAGTVVPHADAAGLAAAVTVTPGYTPTERWTVTYEGALPGLASRRAESGDAGGAPWLALQVGVPGASEIVRLYDPTLGVRGGDTVVVEPTALATCTAPFEATVDPADPFLVPDGDRPGGAVRLAPRGDPLHPEWDACVDALRTPAAETRLLATFRAGDPLGGADRYVLVRGTGAAAIHAGRPSIGVAGGVPFDLTWADEASFGACTLPPRVAWPGTAPCDPTCRSACEGLVRARLARRIGYVPETGNVDPVGPALAFTLALETAAAPRRDLELVIDTRDGRAPSRAADPLGGAVGARSAVAFDRSPYAASAGIRFLVPYASGVVLDASPTAHGSVAALR